MFTRRSLANVAAARLSEHRRMRARVRPESLATRRSAATRALSVRPVSNDPVVRVNRVALYVPRDHESIRYGKRVWRQKRLAECRAS